MKSNSNVPVTAVVDKTGINFEGPAPRPLERYRIFLADDGEIVVDKTKKFQQEEVSGLIQNHLLVFRHKCFFGGNYVQW